MAQLRLNWNSFEPAIIQVFQEMYDSENLVDVTIGCDRSFLKAHKVVLAACSPYFQSLFMSNPCKHPIVILKDVKFEDLKALIEFMYRGEVTVTHEQLPSLLKTAELLQIKQLDKMTERTTEVTTGSGTHRRKRKRIRVKKSGEAGASGESDAESPEKQNATGDFQGDQVSGENENEIALDGATDGSVGTDGKGILELSLAEVVDQHVDGDVTDDAEIAARHLVGSELALTGQVLEEYDEDESHVNFTGTVAIYTGQEDQSLMLMRKKQSFVWEYFIETGKASVKCKKCGKLLSYKDSSGSTSNMIKHLKTVHAVQRAAKPPLQE